jgi:hypothetical protein
MELNRNLCYIYGVVGKQISAEEGGDRLSPSFIIVEAQFF